MSKYIARAYVKIESVSKRLELADKLQEAGVRCLFSVRNGFEKIFVIRGGIAGVPLGDNIHDHIDCLAHTPNGTEEDAVRLFLELVKMNDDEPSTLWYKAKVITDAYLNRITTQRVLVRGLPTGSQYLTCFEDWTGIASPIEVAEAFRDGRIEL